MQTTSYTIKEDFLKNLLIDREIIPENDKEYHQKFFKPTRENMCDPLKLDHMKEGYNLFTKHLVAGNKFYFVVDSDADGITSSAVMINYMEDHLT
jgi:single-stranded DNA-specific DHH superfamily exonuclease